MDTGLSLVEDAACDLEGKVAEDVEEGSQFVSGRDLAGKLRKWFEESCIENSSNVLTIPLYSAAFEIIPVYQVVFGQGMIARMLSQDMRNHAEAVRETVNVNKENEKYLNDDGFITEELSKMTREQMRIETACGVRQLLWMKRTLDFILKFLDYTVIVHLDKSSRDCATMAYDEVLRPYHGVMLATVVSTTFRLCPERYALMSRLGFTDLEEAQGVLKTVLEFARPVVDRVDQCLKKHDCNFPDKVGELSAPSLPAVPPWLMSTANWLSGVASPIANSSPPSPALPEADTAESVIPTEPLGGQEHPASE